jgi:hypothetical protein
MEKDDSLQPRLSATGTGYIVESVVDPDPDPHQFESLEKDPDPRGQKRPTKMEKK